MEISVGDRGRVTGSVTTGVNR